MKSLVSCSMIAAVSWLAAVQAEPHGARLPSEVHDFYQSYNSISALSTSQEREWVAAIADTQHQALSPRLRQILALMHHAERRILESDRGMIIPTDPYLHRWFGDEVLDIHRVRADLDRFFVEVTSLPLAPEQQRTILVELDSQPNPDVPAVARSALGKIIRPARPRTTQIHQWVRRGDAWYVMDVRIQRCADTPHPRGAQGRTAHW